MSSGVIEGRETQGSKQGKKAQKRLLIKKGNKGGKKSCRAEGAEVPVFSWGGVFFIRHCQVCPYIPYFLPDLLGI